MATFTVWQGSIGLVTFLGGLALLAAPLTRNGRAAQRWVRRALGICGVSSIAYGTLNFTMLLEARWHSPPLHYLLANLKPFFGGMAAGILIVLLSSDEFRSAFSSKRAKGSVELK